MIFISNGGKERLGITEKQGTKHTIIQSPSCRAGSPSQEAAGAEGLSYSKRTGVTCSPGKSPLDLIYFIQFVHRLGE